MGTSSRGHPQRIVALIFFIFSSIAVFAEEPADLNVVVEDGDNLTSIVGRVAGSTEHWQLVALYNGLDNPHALTPGQIIVIPGTILERRSYAVVDYFSGEAFYIGPGASDPQPVQRGQRVYTGDRVKTGDFGFVSLSFAGNSVVNIQPKSEFRIDRIDCADQTLSCVITLWAAQGDAAVKVNSEGFDQPTDFTIKTPYASAVVRGTEFDFTVSEADGVVANTLGVTEGKVLVSTDELDREVPFGKGVVGGQGQSVSQLLNLLTAPKITNPRHYLRISPEDRVNWLQLPDAASYEVTVASADGALGKTRLASNYSRIEYPAGDYTVGVRGIDKYGLRGYSAVQAVTAVELVEDEAAELWFDLSTDMLRIEKRRIDPSQRFEIQISDRIATIDGKTQLVDYLVFDLNRGSAFNIPIEYSRDIYMRYRQIVDESSVTAYTPVALLATARDQ